MSSIDSFTGRAPGEAGLGQLLGPPSSHFLANRETSDIFSQFNLSRLLTEMHAYGMASYFLIAMDVKVKSLTSSFHSDSSNCSFVSYSFPTFQSMCGPLPHSPFTIYCRLQTFSWVITSCRTMKKFSVHIFKSTVS